MDIDMQVVENLIFGGTAKEAAEKTGLSQKTIEGYRAKKTAKAYRDWQAMSLKTAIEILKPKDGVEKSIPKLEIENLLELWKAEAENHQSVSEFEKFCTWYGYDPENLKKYFCEFDLEK